MGTDNLHHKRKNDQIRRNKKQIRDYRGSYLIICEGEKTEPNYFKSFSIASVKVEVIGLGRNTNSLVKEAVKIWKRFAKDKFYYEHLWIVFDRDEFPQKNYNQAFEDVKKYEQDLNKKYKKKIRKEIKIKIAYSNESFELWYLLHFEYINTTFTRKQYVKKLDEKMKNQNKRYKKNSAKMYELLQKLTEDTNGKKGQSFAIKNAKKLLKNCNEQLLHNCNPSTTVHKLVLELNKLLKK